MRPDDPSVVYIGETIGSLSSRLGGFERSARTGKRGHSAGRTWHSLRPARCQLAHLFVTVYALPEVENGSEGYAASRVFIKFLEMKAIFQHVKRHGRPPILNKYELKKEMGKTNKTPTRKKSKKRAMRDGAKD